MHEVEEAGKVFVEGGGTGTGYGGCGGGHLGRGGGVTEEGEGGDGGEKHLEDGEDRFEGVVGGRRRRGSDHGRHRPTEMEAGRLVMNR